MRCFRVGVLSDTHGLLRPEVLEILDGCKAILHGGDIHKQEILDRLEQIAPVYAVRGNADKEWAGDLPESRTVELSGVKVFMIHNKKQIPEDLPQADIYVYGHSHRYEEKNTDGKLWLNPGSCGPRRFTQPITLAVLEIHEDRSYHVKKYEIPYQKKNAIPDEQIPSDIRHVIANVMKDTAKGIRVSEIAGRNHISQDLAEQICRLYLTHPGVDVEGIMTKMEKR